MLGGDRVCWGSDHVCVCVGGGDPSADRSRMLAPSVSEQDGAPSPRLVVQEHRLPLGGNEH